MTKTEATPWAPSQHAGMTCDCFAPDAYECLKQRKGHDRRQGKLEYPGCGIVLPCECACHGTDEREFDIDDTWHR